MAHIRSLDINQDTARVEEDHMDMVMDMVAMVMATVTAMVTDIQIYIPIKSIRMLL